MAALRAIPTEYRPFPNVTAKNAVQELFEVPTLVRLLDLPRGVRLLEVGCGRGVALPPLARLCSPSRLVGLDLDGELLREARATIARERIAAELVLGDVRHLPFDDESFDVVVDFGTCYHVAQPERALAEIARVLAPGGLFVHETPMAQLLAHPIRAGGRSLPWAAALSLEPQRGAVFWSTRGKRAA